MEIRAPRDDAEIEALAKVLSASFLFTPEDATSWIEAAKPENARVLIDGAVVAGLITLPMGQFFGGRRVPMTGLAAVGVLPELRGRGLATALVKGVLADLARRGVAISALYPSTLSLYRALGWEIAGSRWEIKLDPRLLEASDHTVPMRRVGTDDVLGIRAAHLQRARLLPGAIDRHPFLWDRVLAPRGQAAEGYVIGDESVDGYVFFQRESRDRGHFDLHVTDLAVNDEATANRLLAFFADMGTLCDKVWWRGHPDDTVLAAMVDRHWSVRQVDPWMLRIVDMAAAFATRGWPAGFDADVELDVCDVEIDANHGRWIASWLDGQVTLTRGGEGRVRVDIRALAALFTGHKSPGQLAATGLLEGEDRDLARLATAFAGPMPTMWDGF